MRLPRVVLWICAVLLATAFAAGCGSDDGDDGGSSSQAASADKPLDGKKIGITPYWLDVGNTIYTNAAKEYLEGLGAKVEILNPDGDAAKQRQQVESFITSGYDGVILCPVNPGQLVSTLKRLQNEDIPTTLFWNLVPEEKMEGLKAPAFELNDYESFKEAGTQAAKYVRDEMQAPPKAIIFDDPSNPVLHARASGFEDGLKAGDPDAEVLFRDAVKFDADGARAKMSDLITTYPDFNILSTTTGESATGAYTALKAAGRGKARDKVPETEWMLTPDPNTQRLGLFLDKSTSVMAVSYDDFKAGGKELGTAMSDLIQDPDWKQVGSLAPVPSALMPSDCDEVAKIFEEQNGELQDFKPVDCSS